MKKVGRSLAVTSIVLIILSVLVVLDDLVLHIGIARLLIRIATVFLGISLCLLSVGLTMWKRKGLSYLELLPSFGKCPRSSE